MPLNVIKKEIEAEREIGYRYLQVLSRAEALVPGAGREAIVPLIWDANAAVIRSDVQNERVVLDGALSCQAVYRQGDENSLRALSAKANLSQVAEIPGAQPGMLSRAQATVENVDVKYENGHMVFLVSLGIHVWVSKLEPIEVITGLEDAEGIETRFRELCLVKLAAEANETAVLTEQVELPKALDARATLMDWGSVTIDSAEPDLGGVRVKGRVLVESLVGSGIEGRPAVTVKYPIEFDKLIELPEWLAREACVYPSIRSIRTQLEMGDGEEDGMLMIQADVRFDIAANLRECVEVLEDAYSTGSRRIDVQEQELEATTGVNCTRGSEIVRGTVMLGDGASVGSVIAVRVLPNVAEVEDENGRSKISGLLDCGVLYMPNGSDQPAAARTTLPFEIEVPQELEDESSIRLSVTSAEANALMSDRLEMKIGLNVFCETRVNSDIEIAREIEEGEAAERRPGYVIYWPEENEDAWAIGRRYAIAESIVRENAENGEVKAGKPLVLRI
ncbi:MAG: DUF3794 domain-containing protein [Clostridia bacterium]|nr:DUF3794 domain-containing protein [Clostridia bacterium]